MALGYCRLVRNHTAKDYSAPIQKAILLIEGNLSGDLSLTRLARELNVNSSYLSTLFKKETGKSISDFIREEKIRAAANMLKFSEYSYGDIAEYFGFASQSHFIECFRKQTGLSPKEYRKKYSRNQEFFAGNSYE